MSEMENSFHLLLFVMAAISISAFVLTNYDILHPFCIVALLMTFSVFLAVLGITILSNHRLVPWLGIT